MQLSATRHIGRVLISALLIALGVSTVVYALEVERLEIEWDRDVKLLPYHFEEQFHYDHGVTRANTCNCFQVLQQALKPGDAALVVFGKNCAYNSNEAASFLVQDFTSSATLSEDPIFTTITGFAISRIESNGSYYLVGGSNRDDSAFVIRNRPGTDHFDQLPLVSGYDHSHDQRWTSVVGIMGQGDYDYDGREEMFFYVSPGRDIEPRVLACVQVEPFELEWMVPVASSMGRSWFFDCRDSTEPSVIFSTYGPQNGAIDKNFDDNYGYLTKINSRGEILFNYRIHTDFGSPGITPTDSTHTRFCVFHRLPLSLSTVVVEEGKEPPKEKLSIIDRDGSVIVSTDAYSRLSSIWYEIDPHTNVGRIYTLWANGIIRIYDQQLLLLAESEPTNLNNFLSQEQLVVGEQPGRFFNSSHGLVWYSESFELQAIIGHSAAAVTPLSHGPEGVTRLLYSSSNSGGIVKIKKREFWVIIKTMFWENQDVVLFALIVLAIGLVLSNAFRMKVVSKLAEREQTLRSLFENMPDGAYRADLNGSLVWVSPACVKMLGYSHESEILSLQVSDFYRYPEKRHETLARLEQDGRVADWEVELIMSGGGIIVVSANVSYFYDKNGEVAGVEGVLRDITDRKRSENALAHSEEKYRLLVENVGASISLVSNDGVFQFINEQGALFHKLSIDEIVGKTVWDLIPNEIADSYMISAREVIKNGEEFSEEIQSFIGGQWYWSQVNIHPYRDSTGKITAAMIIALDITERKQTEERIRLLTSAVEQSSEGLAVIGLDGNILFINEAFAALHGYVPDELLNEHVSIFHTPDQMPVVESVNKHIQETGSFAGEIWHVRRDGTTFPALMNNSTIIDESGTPVGLIGTMIDITDRKKAEEDLRHRADIEALVASVSTEFINMPVEQINDGITQALSRVGEFIRADRGYLFFLSERGDVMKIIHQWHTDGTASMADIAGSVPLASFPWWSDTLKSENYVAISHPSDLPPEAAVEQSYFEKQGTKSVLAVALRSSQQLIGSLHFSCLRKQRDWPPEDIRMMNMIGEIFSNALERKRATVEIERSNQERLNQERQIAGGFAHEIRNALFPARGLLEKLTENDAPESSDDDKTLYSQMIDQSLSRAMGIVRAILDYTRLGTQRAEQEVCLSEIIEGVLTANQVIILSKGVNVGRSGPKDISVLSNNSQLYTVINNLLLNALDALKDAPTPAIDIRWERDGKNIKLIFSDNGSGIEKELLPRIFEAFYSTKPDRGTGLGLAISRKIVELYQGSISVDSELGEGARFVIILRATR